MAKKEKAKPAAKVPKAAKPPKEKKVKGGGGASPGGGFFLRMGDKLALGIGVFLLLVMVFLGMSVGDSSKPGAEKIKQTTEQAENAIRTAPGPRPEELPPADMPFTLAQIEEFAERPFIPPQEHRFMKVFINPSPTQDLLLRNPQTLAVKELAATPVRFAFKYPHIDAQRGVIYLIEEFKELELKTEEITDPKLKEAVERAKKRAEKQKEKLSKSQIDKSKATSNPTGRAGFVPGMPMEPPAGGTKGKITITTRSIPKPIDQLKDDDIAKVAQTLIPTRGVLIVGSFPLREQVVEIARALKLPEDGEINTYFNRLEVQRREVSDPSRQMGRHEGWSSVDVQFTNNILYQLDYFIGEWEEEPLPEFMHAYGLHWPLPAAQRGKYPEDYLKGTMLSGIQKTLTDYNNLQEAERKLREPPKPKIFLGDNKDDFKIYDIGQDVRGSDGRPQPVPTRRDRAGRPPEGSGFPFPMTMGPERMERIRERSTFFAEYCMVRWLDIDPSGKLLQPGRTYEYRVRVVMDNPNHGRPDVADPYDASLRELAGDWSDPVRVAFGPETFIYADERKLNNKDRVPVQIHRWLDWINLMGGTAQDFPFGDWWVDRIGVGRGEYVGRIEDKEMIVWIPTTVNPTTSTIGIDAPRSVRTDSLTTRSLLVDFQGGDQETLRLSAGVGSTNEARPVEVLIVHPDGRMVAQQWLKDRDNPDMQSRFDRWKTWVELVKSMFSE